MVSVKKRIFGRDTEEEAVVKFEDFPKDECVFCVFNSLETGVLAVLIIPEIVIPRGVYAADDNIVKTMINNVMMPEDPAMSPAILHSKMVESGFRWSPNLASFLKDSGDRPYMPSSAMGSIRPVETVAAPVAIPVTIIDDCLAQSIVAPADDLVVIETDPKKLN